MFGIDDAIGGIAKLVDDAVTRIWPDATEVEKEKLAQLTTELSDQFQIQLAQITVNTEEAKNTSLFVSGWRPAVGWVCVFGYGYEFLLRPIVNGFGWQQWPGIEVDALSSLLFGLLGLAAARTVEKIKGVAAK